jgi:DNA-directed RNA polymerase specialized sigma24 family protein
VRCQPDRDRSWQGWLVRTAQREAWQLHAKEAAHGGFDLPEKPDVLIEPADPRDMLALRTDLRAALDLLAAVPERRREAKALHVTGYTYDEIAERLGLGHARVNTLVAEAPDA